MKEQKKDKIVGTVTPNKELDLNQVYVGDVLIIGKEEIEVKGIGKDKTIPS